MTKSAVSSWLLLFIGRLLLEFCHAANDTQCPPVPTSCLCTHKNKKNAIRIVCNGLKTKKVSLQSLPTDLSMEIYLSGNGFEKIDNTSFPNPNLIRKLILRDNSINEIGPDSFQGFKELKKLDLSGNQLVQITDRSFSGLEATSLSVLDLSENRILEVTQRAFSGLKIGKLILKRQWNIYKKKAELISFPDFLSFSMVQTIDVDEINFLCDCNLKWLSTWLQRSPTHKLIDNAQCYFPVPLRGQFVRDVILSPTWNCGQYAESFALPQFQLNPSSSQLLFEKDSIAVACQSTWMQRMQIMWRKDGTLLDSSKQSSRMEIQVMSDLNLAFIVSTLVINRIELSDSGNLSCEVKMQESGYMTSSIKLHVISASGKTCKSDVSDTDRGSMSWPTALNGADSQTTCPHGGVGESRAIRTCVNGDWSSVTATNCFVGIKRTQQLHTFFYKAQMHRNIRIVGNEFSTFFQQNFYQIKSKYDLYYVSKTLHEVMKAYEGVKYGYKRYAKFFWGTVGLISDYHRKIKSMTEVVFDYTASWRFRKLLEHFVQQESRIVKIFSINNHRSMAAVSYNTIKSYLLQCYVTIRGSNDGNDKRLQVVCVSAANNTLSRISPASLQLVVGGANDRNIRFTSVVHLASTFFQSERKPPNSTVIASPIVGVHIKEPPFESTESEYYRKMGAKRKSVITFRSKFDHVDPHLLFWQVVPGKQGHWVTLKECSLLPTKIDLRDTTQFQCHFQPKFFEKFQYFALSVATEWPTEAPELGAKESSTEILELDGDFVIFIDDSENEDYREVIILKPHYMEPVIYVGAALACVLIVLTLLVYALIRKLRYNRNDAAILMNLCLVLIAAELIFAVGMHRTDNRLMCKGVAVALHYLLLCAFLWLTCAAIVLLRLLKRKIRYLPNSYDPVLKFYLIAWGLPLIFCSITVAYDRDNYGMSNYCWLKPTASIGAFIIPACLVLFIDLVIFCYVHALINRVYPEPEEGEEDDEDSEELINRDQCNPKSCKYKMKPLPPVEQRFPGRSELIFYLKGCLAVILFLTMTFVFTLMMYSYENTKSKYLYYLFCYGSAISNLLIGGVLFLFHCVRRKDVVRAVREYVIHLRHTEHVPEAEIKDEDNPPPHSPAIEVKSKALSEEVYLPSDIISEHSNFIGMTHGVYGLSDIVQSEGSQIVATVHVENVPCHEGQGESIDDIDGSVKRPTSDSIAVPDSDASLLNEPQNKSKSHHSQSEMSEVEKMSNGGHNSIGECSLTSSRNHKRVRPKNPDIPENIKAFVPENWRPARRRGKSKGASYYPYYINDTGPVNASVAYSSKSSSIASTTVSGVPLYINKKRAANNLAMYNELFNPHRTINPMGPMRQPLPPSGLQNVTGSPTPQYPLSMGPPPGYLSSPSYPLTSLNPVQEGFSPSVCSSSVIQDEYVSNSKQEEFANNNYPRQQPVQEDSTDMTLTQEEEESEEEPIKTAPIIYICMPHVSIKQFEMRSETSV